LSASVALTIQFSASASAEQALGLKHVHTLRLGPDGAIDVFMVIPAVSAALYPSIGSARLVPGEAQTFEQIDIVKFNNSRQASLKYPPHGLVACRVLTDLGNNLGIGGGGGVSVRYDSDIGKVVASRAFTGLVEASYTVSYLQARVTRFGDAAKASGNLVAIYRNAMAEASFGGLQPVDPITVYSVVSEYVADEQGAWEVPPEWPEDNTFPIREDEPLPNQDSYQQLERVHENAFIDGAGLLTVERYTVRWEEPYRSPGTLYHPKYKFDPGIPPPEDSDWSDAWSSINWASIYNSVRQRYPDIQGTG
jgi:hypothetical protein